MILIKIIFLMVIGDGGVIWWSWEESNDRLVDLDATERIFSSTYFDHLRLDNYAAKMKWDFAMMWNQTFSSSQKFIFQGNIHWLAASLNNTGTKQRKWTESLINTLSLSLALSLELVTSWLKLSGAGLWK